MTHVHIICVRILIRKLIELKSNSINYESQQKVTISVIDTLFNDFIAIKNACRTNLLHRFPIASNRIIVF